MRNIAPAVVVALLGCSSGSPSIEEVLASTEFQEMAASASYEEAAARWADWQAEGPLPIDPWGNPYRLAVEALPDGEGFSIEIMSLGSDGRLGPCRCNDPGGDLVWRDGFFVRDESTRRRKSARGSAGRALLG